MKAVSIRKDREFKRLYNKGKKFMSRYFVIYYSVNNLGTNRLGLTVSKKMGNAVVRNRIRRRLKEAFRLSNKPGESYDYIVVGRKRAEKGDFQEIKREMQKFFDTLS